MNRPLKRGNKEKVCLLKRALYGLKQASRQWFKKLDQCLKGLGFKPSTADTCIYVAEKGGGKIIIAVYVDDLIVAYSDDKFFKEIKEKLMMSFRMKDLGNLKYCLGMEFNQENGKVKINQRKYINDMLTKFKMENCKPVSSPMEVEKKLQKNTSHEQINVPYQNLIGSLLYLAVATRPDISFAVSYLSQFNNCFDYSHWTAAKRVLRYLKGTKNQNLVFSRKNQPIIGYADADWGSCIIDRKSYTGYVFLYSGAPISWESRKQKTVALSTAEAEYMALTEGAKEAIHLKNLLNDLKTCLDKILILSDNQAAQSLAANPIVNNKSKHISIKEHFIRNVLEEGLIELDYIPTKEMLADILTKSLVANRHNMLCKKFGMEIEDVDS